MYSHSSHEEGVASRSGTPHAGASAPSIDFYLSMSDDEAPLTGRALRDVLEAGSQAVASITAREPPPAGRRGLSLREANPMLLALLRASPSGAAYAEGEGAREPSRAIDVVACLPDGDIASIGPVDQAASRRNRGNAPARSETLSPPRADDGGTSNGVMRYLHTLQTEVVSTTEDLLACDASEANSRFAQSLIDSWLSDTAHLALTSDAPEPSVSSAVLQQNPLLLSMLEAPTVTAAAYDTFGLPSTVGASLALAPDRAPDAQAYAVITETISEASTPSPVSACEPSHGNTRNPPQMPTADQVQERARGTAGLLHLLGAVVRRDIALPKNMPTTGADDAQHDARFLLCAAYRAIVMDVPGKYAWLPLQRFTDALNLDLSTFTRWAARYRQEDGAVTAFWETLAPHTWIDAFAVIDALEAGRGGIVPTADDLATSALHGCLKLGRGKRRDVRLLGRMNEWRSGTETVDARPSGSGAQGAAHVSVQGSAVPAASVSSHGVDGIDNVAASVAPGGASMPRELVTTVPISDALRRTAWRIRLVAAAASGAIVLERPAVPPTGSVRRYDPRYLLTAAYETLAEQLRVGANTLRLRTLSILLGLVPRTVYAWRTSYLRNRCKGAAFGRRMVAEGGTDHAAFIAAMKAVMREPAPVLADLRATSLHDRLLGLFECTLKMGGREEKPKDTRRSSVPRRALAESSARAAPSAASGSGDSVQPALEAPYPTAVAPVSSGASAAQVSGARRCSF